MRERPRPLAPACPGARAGVALAAALWACAAGAAGQDGGRADPGRWFAGPVPARHFQPIQLIFLHLPFERAAAAEPGVLTLEVQSAESDVIATTQGRIESRLQFETNRTVLGARYGVAPGWEVSVQVPFISRYGGFLDPFIDEVEGLVGAGNPERDFYRNNTFGDFFVRRGRRTLFSGGHLALRPGDVAFFAKRAWSPGDSWPTLAVRFALEVPTGSQEHVTGSGTVDLGIGVAADYRAHRRVMLYGNVGLVYPLGRVTPADLTLNPLVGESFAIEVALARRWTAQVHQATYTSPMHGTGTALLDGPSVEMGLGLSWHAAPWLTVQALAIDNVSGVEKAADFTVLVNAAVRLRGRAESVRRAR